MAIMAEKSIFIIVLAFVSGNGVYGAVFTLLNQCPFTVWPGTLTGSGAPISLGANRFPENRSFSFDDPASQPWFSSISDAGVALAPGTTVRLQAPPSWSGRIWPRTGCSFDAAGAGTCTTGDCPGGIKCTGGGQPPTTLAEFTLAPTPAANDFYDVSLVDGYNIGVGIKTTGGGTGDCTYAGCVFDLNAICPSELRVVLNGSVVACQSACAAFGTAEYCCTGEHATPATCPATNYSQVFKTACPAAYSYAYDDATSTRTCAGTDYLITFCPNGL